MPLSALLNLQLHMVVTWFLCKNVNYKLRSHYTFKLDRVFETVVSNDTNTKCMFQVDWSVTKVYIIKFLACKSTTRNPSRFRLTYISDVNGNVLTFNVVTLQPTLKCS